MKRLSPGIWKEEIDHATITVNENLNTISVVFENGKEVSIKYPDAPKISDVERFIKHVEEATEVFEVLKPIGDDVR